ncbi:hypothetical protein V5F63_19455 [Xanthobacter autotrophicus DSM 597]|uniref:hypothetical protein n=1 Tax=Xanthobacter wiegelii TaxID=3119913 RepID=UPI00372AD694
MICAECDRCHRRSILSARGDEDGRLEDTSEMRANSLRCDLCGSRRVRLVRVASPFEAVAFINGRLAPDRSGG